MLMEEEEARTKICNGCQDALCQASDCMAWRWVIISVEENGRAHYKGYCGLAGKPEGA